MEEVVSSVARRSSGRLRAALATSAVVVVLIAALTFVAAASAAADFSYSPAAPKAGELVTFTSTSTLQRPITLEQWDFESDGRFEVSGHVVTYTFASPGTYKVTLRVEDDRRWVRRTSKVVTVAPAPPPPPPPQEASPPPAPPPPLPPFEPAPVTVAAAPPAAPIAIAPFPVVRITGSYTPRGVRLRLVSVTAPAGVSIRVRCRGRGCPHLLAGPLVVGSTGTRPTRAVQIRGFRGRLLRPGARLEVFVAHADRIGKYMSFSVRRGSPRRTDRCLRPGGESVFSCG